jgi:hypothetical protein
MNSRADIRADVRALLETRRWRIHRVAWSNPSARVLLTGLFLVSLNAVACYDWILSKVLTPIRWMLRRSQ